MIIKLLIPILISYVMGSSYHFGEEDEFPCGHPDFEPLRYPEVENLLKKMNLDEKLGQLVQINIGIMVTDKKSLKLDPQLVEYYVNQKQVGSFLNNLADGEGIIPATPAQFLEATNTLQAAYMKNRLKIPMVYGVDSVHGANYIYGATLLPQQLALASTFNRKITKQAGEITARDTRAVGIHWNFSPILDIAVNKQWPRVYETFGEDPYVAAELGRAIVLGYQGCDLSLSDKVAATMKHFIGYSASRSGRDVDGAWMSERIINDYFRPPFQAVIGAGIATAMESYSDIEGDHLVNSKKYLVDLLRTKMKFKGALVTDWGQIEKLHDPIHIASSQEDAVRRTMKLGTVDMSMVPNNANFTDHLKNLLLKNQLKLNVIENNVRRVLNLKHKLGLLGTTGHVSDNTPGFKAIGTDKATALDAAREAVILLQNKNNVLPLKRGAKLMVTGPTADSFTYLTGGWTYAWQGTDNDSWFQGNGTTILNGLRQYSSKITYYNMVDINGNSVGDSKVDSLQSQATDYDAVVVCLGENHYTELMGNINNMQLPKGQIELYESILDLTDKPVILILTQGRPRVIGDRTSELSAVITSFLAGPYSGQAIADIIFGQVNPSGKLPITYSNHNNDNNLNYYHRFNENWNPGPMWEFGHGLSYTKFNYSNITLSQTSMSPSQTIDVTVTVTNSGHMAGKEVVLMYITDIYRTIAPEVKKLRGFEKIDLKPNQSKQVNFTINPNDLMYAGLDNNYVIERGTFTVTINDKSTNFELEMEEEFLMMGQ